MASHVEAATATAAAELGHKKASVAAAIEQLVGAEEDQSYEEVVRHSNPIRRRVVVGPGPGHRGNGMPARA